MALIALEGFVPNGSGPYVAKSASSKSENWPIWYVEGGEGVNAMSGPNGAVFTIRSIACSLAEQWNSQR
jgi:hypothetical protein